VLHVQVKVFRQAPETKPRAWDCSTKLAAWFEKAARHGDAAALLRRMADEPGLNDDEHTALLCRTADAQVSRQAAQHERLAGRQWSPRLQMCCTPYRK
jgi:predicted DsbA family dithiol-disulfide isomerase